MAEARAAIEQDRYQQLLDHHRRLWGSDPTAGVD
jgi:hypothetical protein